MPVKGNTICKAQDVKMAKDVQGSAVGWVWLTEVGRGEWPGIKAESMGWSHSWENHSRNMGFQ